MDIGPIEEIIEIPITEQQDPAPQEIPSGEPARTEPALPEPVPV